MIQSEIRAEGVRYEVISFWVVWLDYQVCVERERKMSVFRKLDYNFEDDSPTHQYTATQMYNPRGSAVYMN